MRHKAVLARRSQTIDLEEREFKIEEGKTYFDDGTTVFDVYVDAGLADGAFELTHNILVLFYQIARNIFQVLMD
jgi:hypothetical protein